MKGIYQYLSESTPSKSFVVYEINGDEISSQKYVDGMDESECKEYAVREYHSIDELVDAINSRKYDDYNLLKVIYK